MLLSLPRILGEPGLRQHGSGHARPNFSSISATDQGSFGGIQLLDSAAAAARRLPGRSITGAHRPARSGGSHRVPSTVPRPRQHHGTSSRCLHSASGGHQHQQSLNSPRLQQRQRCSLHQAERPHGGELRLEAQTGTRPTTQSTRSPSGVWCRGTSSTSSSTSLPSGDGALYVSYMLALRGDRAWSRRPSTRPAMCLMCCTAAKVLVSSPGTVPRPRQHHGTSSRCLHSAAGERSSNSA